MVRIVGSMVGPIGAISAAMKVFKLGTITIIKTKKRHTVTTLYLEVETDLEIWLKAKEAADRWLDCWSRRTMRGLFDTSWRPIGVQQVSESNL